MATNIEQKIRIEDTVWGNRSKNIFPNTQEQTNLKVKLANFLGISDKNGIELLDEAVARAFRNQNNPKYEALFKEGNPELIEAVTLFWYGLGWGNGSKVLKTEKIFENLDISKDEFLAEQFVNQIPDKFKSHKERIENWSQTQKNIAKASLPEVTMEMSQEDIDKFVSSHKQEIKIREIKISPLDKLPIDKELVENEEDIPIIKLEKRIIRKAERQKRREERKQKREEKQIEKSKTKQKLATSTDLDIDSEVKSFGKIEIIAPKEVEELLDAEILGKKPKQLRDMLDDIENLIKEYELNITDENTKNYLVALKNKSIEVNKRIGQLQDLGIGEVVITSEKELVFPQLDIPKYPEIVVTAKKEEMKVKGRPIKAEEITQMPVTEEIFQETEKLSILTKEEQRRAKRAIKRIEQEIWEENKQKLAVLDELPEEIQTGYSRGKKEKYVDEPIAKKTKGKTPEEYKQELDELAKQVGSDEKVSLDEKMEILLNGQTPEDYLNAQDRKRDDVSKFLLDDKNELLVAKTNNYPQNELDNIEESIENTKDILYEIEKLMVAVRDYYNVNYEIASLSGREIPSFKEDIAIYNNYQNEYTKVISDINKIDMELGDWSPLSKKANDLLNDRKKLEAKRDALDNAYSRIIDTFASI